MNRNTGTVIELELAGLEEPEWLAAQGAPLMVSFTAEAVRFEGAQLQFVTGGAVVRTVPLNNVAAFTWRSAGPRGPQSATSPRNAGTSWSEEEREQLRAEVLGDLTWSEVGRRHERTVSAVRAEAVRQQLVDETGRRLDKGLRE
ncbi:MAG TPA: hypothetical protein VGX23_33500 [Actinocrinis sp.]|nr:hypothetical protein [Actinocrinis sp.]